MTAVPPFIPHPSQPTAVDLCNGYTYTFPPSTASSASSSIPPARLAVFDPQMLWDRLRSPIEQLFPLSSVVLRGKTGQVTISNVDVQVVSVHSSPSQPVISSTATALRSAISWQHLPYLHMYVLTTASYTTYIKHHRLLIGPFVAAFTDASTAAGSATSPSISSASTSMSTSPSSSVPAGSDVLLLYCMHVDERKDSKNERKVLDKLRNDWGKDNVVPIVLADEWWAGWNGEGGAGPAAAGGGSEEGVMASISISSLFPSASSSNLSPASNAPPPLTATLLPSLRARFTASSSTRCDSLHSIVHSLLLLSAYPHWPFTRFLLTQFTAARVHCQFGLYVEALRLLDEAAAVMDGPTVQQLIGDAATQNKVRLRYLYDEGGGGRDDDVQQEDVEEVELFYNRLSLLQCERLLYAQQAAILRRMGRIEEVVERGEALLVRWMEREGWEVWGWILGCVVDVWSRAEREVRERHADERRSRGGGGGDDDKRADKAGEEESKDEKHKRHRLSATTIRPRSITPERRRRHSPKPNPSSTTTAANTTTEDKQQQPTPDTDDTAATSTAATSAPATIKAPPHKRSQTHRQLASVSVRGNHALTAQLRHLHVQRVSSMFGCVNRLMEERKRVEREKGRFDVMDDDGRVESKRRRDRLRDDREERERRLAEWKEREGNDYMLLLDDEVASGEVVYEQRQRKVEYAMQHSCLFPVLLHALLFFTSPSAAHSYHFMSLYCHAFAALSLPSFSSSLHLYLSSVYCWQRWLGLTVREMEWRLREESDARRWTGVAHSVLMLLGLRRGLWLDVRVRETSEDVLAEADHKTASPVAAERVDWFCCVDQPANETLQFSDPNSLLSLFGHICSHHLPAVLLSTAGQPSIPIYHRCRALGTGQSPTGPTLPLPRPSIPSPAALTSILLSSRASPSPSNASIAFVAPLSSLVPIDSFTVTIHPCFSPIHLCLRLTFATSSASLLASELLDDVAFTVSLQRRDERMDIDCEYHQQVRLAGNELWLHAVMAAEGDEAAQVETLDSHHMCVLCLSPDDYGALQSLLDVSADDENPLLVSLSHMWLRYHRLHLLPLDRAALDQALTVNIDYATTQAASTIAASTSASRFLQPFFADVGPSALSPRASLASSPLSLTFVPSSQPAVLDSTASMCFALHTTAPLPSCRLLLVAGGCQLVGEVSVLVSSADGGSQQRVVQVVDGAALLGPLSLPSLCVLECRITSPSSHSIAHDAVELSITARVSADFTSVDLPVSLRFVLPFSVSASLLHLGHRLFVCAVIRCCQPGMLYQFDRVSVEWSKRWAVLSTAGEAELSGAVVAGGADVRLMSEVECEKSTAPEEMDADAMVEVRARVTSSSDGDAFIPSLASSVVSHLPLRLPFASLRPPLLHLILSSPSSARVGHPITLSLTILLSSSDSSSPSALAVHLLCCLSPSSAFYISGHSTFTVRLSHAAPSYNHSVVLLPLQAGAMLLPSIVVKEKRPSAGSGASVEEERWLDVSDGRLQCHFGVERVRVLPCGVVRCELKQEQEAALAEAH